MELDVVAESLDRERLLVGEVKWAARSDLPRWRAELHAKAAAAPFVRGRRVVHALWVKGPAKEAADVVTPDQVMDVLR